MTIPNRLCEDLRELLPESPNQPYDMKKVITSVVDGGDYMEVHASYAQQVTCGFARIDGHTVGIVSNQPQILAGVLDIESSEKAARFVRTCDAFNVPIVTFVDVPGFMPGVDQEYGGIIRHGAKLLYAFCEATVPRISVVTRKAYGGAYVVMNSKSVGADLAPRLADRGDRRDGSPRVRWRSCIAATSPRLMSGRVARATSGRLRRALRDALHRGRARIHRRRDRSGRDPTGTRSFARSSARQARRIAQAQARERAAVNYGLAPRPTLAP